MCNELGCVDCDCCEEDRIDKILDINEGLIKSGMMDNIIKEAYTEVAKLTWLEELNNGVKLYLKVRGQTYSLEFDDKPDNLLEFKIEFKKNFDFKK